MPQCKTKNGKTVITLYEREKKALRDAYGILEFIGRVAEETSDLHEAVNASSSIGIVLSALAVAEEKPSLAKSA